MNPFDTGTHSFANPWVQDPATGVMLTPGSAPRVTTPPEMVRALLATPWPGLFIKADHEPRAQFSASQLETAQCQYLWGLQYLIGLRKPEKRIETREDEAEALLRLPNVDKRERSLLFGTLLHKRLERYFKGESVDWTDDVGQRALMGLQFLPQPTPYTPGTYTQNVLRIEAAIHLQPNTIFGGMHIAFVGSADLEDPEILYDYKTTGNFRWMKRPDELRENLQACVYALSSMQRKGTRVQRCRWVYFSSVGKPEARKVDFEITYDEALAVVRSAFVLASTLQAEVKQYRDMLAEVEYIEGTPDVVRRLPLIDHLPKNTSRCNAYAGCHMHSIAGGPCNAGQAVIDLESVTEHKPKQGDTDDMASLAERLKGMSEGATQGQPQQSAPLNVNPFAAPAPAPVPATAPAFPGPQVPADVLTGPAPTVAPFNPGANPFAAVAPAPAPAPVAHNPFSAAAPAPAPAPVQPTFAASSLPPAAPMAQHQFGAGNPFGPPPVQAIDRAPAQGTFPTGNTEMQPRFPGVNSPEASTAISADAAAAQPQGKRKRRTQAEMQAARAQQPANTPGTGATVTQPDGYNVTITITDEESGAVITIPAPDNIASMMVGALGSVFEGLR